MTTLRRTGAPEPPTVEELICAFAHGDCACARTGNGPCEAVKVVAGRIRNRVLLDVAEAKRRAA